MYPSAFFILSYDFYYSAFFLLRMITAPVNDAARNITQSMTFEVSPVLGATLELAVPSEDTLQDT